MGSGLTKDYDVVEKPVGLTGPYLQWRVYSATKRSTSQAVSIIVCRKADVEKTHGTDVANMSMALLRRSAAILSRLRHPSILRVLEPPLFNPKEVALVVEPVECTLASALLEPSLYPSVRISGLDARLGLTDIAEALSFCHSSAKFVQANVETQCVFITRSGRWKLGGFEFGMLNDGLPAAGIEDISSPKYSVRSFDRGLFPNLDYAAPEYVAAGTLSPQADLWSFGALAYRVLAGSKIMQVRDRPSYLSSVRSLSLDASIPDLAALTKVLLVEGPRPSMPELLASNPFFQDPPLAAIRSLDTIQQAEPARRAASLRALTGAVPSLPPHVVVRRVLPVLQPLLSDTQMTLFALEPILRIAEGMDSTAFMKHIMPSLAKALTIPEPPQIPSLLLRNIGTILSRLGPSDIQTHIIPFLVSSMGSRHEAVVEQAVKQIGELMGGDNRLQYIDFKQKVLPKLLSILTKGSHEARVESLVCLGNVASMLDRECVLGQILPALRNAVQVDRHSTVLMTAVGVYNTIAKNTTPDFIAANILPSVIPLTIERSLSASQFSLIMKAIRTMLETIEKDRSAELEERAALEAEAKAMEKPRVEAPRPVFDMPKPSDMPARSETDFFSASITARASPLTLDSAPVPSRPRKAPSPPVAPRAPPPPSHNASLLFEGLDSAPAAAPASRTPASRTPGPKPAFDDPFAVPKKKKPATFDPFDFAKPAAKPQPQPETQPEPEPQPQSRDLIDMDWVSVPPATPAPLPAAQPPAPEPEPKAPEQPAPQPEPEPQEEPEPQWEDTPAPEPQWESTPAPEPAPVFPGLDPRLAAILTRSSSADTTPEPEPEPEPEQTYDGYGAGQDYGNSFDSLMSRFLSSSSTAKSSPYAQAWATPSSSNLEAYSTDYSSTGDYASTETNAAPSWDSWGSTSEDYSAPTSSWEEKPKAKSSVDFDSALDMFMSGSSRRL